MKIFKIIYSIIATTFILYSCDIIESPYTDKQSIEPPVTDTIVQKILIEDFTGHTCVNCPEAQVIARQIAESNPGRVFIMGLHTGSYALPTVNHTYDFRTKTGNEIDAHFKVSDNGLPLGLINRKKYKEYLILDRGDWDAATNEALQTEPVLGLTIVPSYDDSKKEIKANIVLTYIKPGLSSHHLCVFILEDSIISYQKSRNGDIEDYEHNHVLRSAITGTWGDQLSPVDIKAGSKFTKSYSFSITSENDSPDDKYYWRPNKLKILAFVIDHDNNYEVVQVEEKDLFLK